MVMCLSFSEVALMKIAVAGFAAGLDCSKTTIEAHCFMREKVKVN